MFSGKISLQLKIKFMKKGELRKTWMRIDLNQII